MIAIIIAIVVIIIIIIVVVVVVVIIFIIIIIYVLTNIFRLAIFFPTFLEILFQQMERKSELETN